MQQDIQSSQSTKSLQNQLSQTTLSQAIQPQQQMIISQTQKIKFSQTINRFKQLLKEFLKENDKKVFIIQDGSQIQIFNILKLWMQRPYKKQCYILHLELVNPKLSLNKIKEIFDFYPSVKVYYNQERIQNNNVLKTQGDYFYQGNSKYMHISSEIRSTEYNGQVTESIPYLPHGRGMLRSKKEGFIYNGYFMEGKFHGSGQLKNSKNVHYVGQFKNDYKSGKGIEVIMKRKKNTGKGQPTFIRKSMYQGQFFQGERNGKGIQQTPNGVYEGQWKNGVKCGKGVMMYKNGDRYDGQWDNNQFNGTGAYEQKGNCVYEGDFQDGKYHGEGKMQYEKGDKYQGSYKYGKKEGQGIYTWSDGDYYDGEWKNDSAQGRGTSMIGTDFYDGEYQNGRRHGEGELTDQEGNVLKAMWEKNQIVKKISMNGQPIDQ